MSVLSEALPGPRPALPMEVVLVEIDVASIDVWAGRFASNLCLMLGENSTSIDVWAGRFASNLCLLRVKNLNIIDVVTNATGCH